MTVGEVLFLGGVVGLVISFVLLIIILTYLRKKRKKIQENLEKNYG